MRHIRRICCFIPCDSTAVWQIWNREKGADPYDYTDACHTHLSDLMEGYKVLDVEWIGIEEPEKAAVGD